MVNPLRFLSRLALFACLTLLLAAPASAAMVRVLTVQGAISPASADYLLRGLAEAAADIASLRTPATRSFSSFGTITRNFPGNGSERHATFHPT